MTSNSTDIEKLLSNRLEVVRSERAATREAFNALDTKIKAMKKAMGTPPRESLEAITNQIQTMERDYSRISRSKAEERSFMYEMDKLKQKKKAISAYVKQNAELEVLKVELNELRNQLLMKETAMEELVAGLKKVEIASKVHVENHEVVVKVYRVADIAIALAELHSQTPSATQLVEDVEQCIARIVGKNGSNIKVLEYNFNVHVSINNADQTIEFMGTVDDIMRAYEHVYLLCDTLHVELNVTEECINYLTNNKFDLINELSAKHGVKIDVFQAKNGLKVHGLTNNVRAAENDLKIINKNIIRSDILLEASYFAFIIGKGGANIRAVESAHHVICKIDKDANRLAVIGMKANVQSASEDIKNNIQDNKEVEMVVPCEKHVFLGAFIGADGGQTLKNITKDFNVRVDTDAKEGVSESKDNKEAVKDYSLKVKGQNSKVLAAVEQIRAVISQYVNHTSTIQVSEDIMPILMGKGGANIRALREKYASANIDINGQTVFVQCDDNDLRDSIENDIHNLIDVNYSTTIDMSENNIGLLMKLRFYSQRLKPELAKQSVSLFVNRKQGNLKLRGPQESVDKFFKIIRDYDASLSSHDLEIDSEDFNLFIKPYHPASSNTSAEDGKEGSNLLTVLRCMEELYDVDISLDRKGSSNKQAAVKVNIRGVQGQITQVVAHFEGILKGDARFHSAVVSVPRAVIPAVIGKAGANVKKLESEYDVIVDYNKSKGVVRIYGLNATKREAVKTLVSSYYYTQRVTEVLHVTKDNLLVDVVEGDEEDKQDTKKEDKADHKKEKDDGKRLGSPILDAVVKKAMDIFKVDIERSNQGGNTKLTMRGYLPILKDVRNFFNLFFSPLDYSFHLQLLSEHIQKFKSLKLPKNLEVFQSKYHVKVVLNDVDNSIGYQYPSAAVSALPANANPMDHVHAVVTKQMVIRQAFLKNVHSLFPAQTAFLEAPRSFLFDHLTPQQSSSHYHNLYMHLQSLSTSLSLDIFKGIIFICAADLSAAMAYIDDLLVAWNQRNNYLPIPSAAVLQLLVSRQHVHNLAGISTKLNLQGVADLILDRQAMELTVHMVKEDSNSKEEKEEGEVVQDLPTITSEVQKILDALQREQREVPVSNTEVLPLFIGKQGANINALRAEFGVNIDVDDKGKFIRVTGPEDKVAEAVVKIEAFLVNELQNLQVTRTFQLQNTAIIPALIGSKGARIKAIEEGCEVRCDIDKVKKRVSVRGKATACEKALEEFNTVLGEEGHPAVTYLAPRPPSPEPEEEKDDVVEEEAIHAVPRGPRVIPGSAPTATNVVAAVVGKQLSKSAQRRLRRKLASVEEPDHEDGAGNDEADHEHAEATVPVVTTPSPPAPPVAEPATVKQASPSIPENVAPTPVQIAAAVRAAPVNVPTPVVVVPTPVAPVAAPVKMEPIASLKTPSVSTPSPLPPVASAPAPALKAAAPAPIPASIEPIGGGILSRGVPAKPSALPAAPGLPAPSSNYKQSDLLALLLGDEPVANSTMAAKPANYAPYMQFGGQQPTFSGASTLLGNASNSTVPPINPRSLPPPGLGDSTGKNPSPNYYKSKSGLTVRL